MANNYSLNSTDSLKSVEPFDFTNSSHIKKINSNNALIVKYNDLPKDGELFENKEHDLYKYIINYIKEKQDAFYYCVLKLQPISKNRVDNDACRLLIIKKKDGNTQLYCYKINIVYRRRGNRVFLRKDRLLHFLNIYYEDKNKNIKDATIAALKKEIQNLNENINTFKRTWKSSETYNFNKIIAMFGIKIIPLEGPPPPLIPIKTIDTSNLYTSTSANVTTNVTRKLNKPPVPPVPPVVRHPDYTYRNKISAGKYRKRTRRYRKQKRTHRHRKH